MALIPFLLIFLPLVLSLQIFASIIPLTSAWNSNTVAVPATTAALSHSILGRCHHRHSVVNRSRRHCSSRRRPIVIFVAAANVDVNDASSLSNNDDNSVEVVEVVPTDTEASSPTPPPSTTTTVVDNNNNDQDFFYDDVIRAARDDLVALSKALTSKCSDNEDGGDNVYIRRPSDALRLLREIDRLEALVAGPYSDATSSNLQRRLKKKELLVGDWTLLATAVVPSSGFRGRPIRDDDKRIINDGGRSRSAKGIGPLFRELQQKPSIEVTQRIRCTTSEDLDDDVDDDDDGSTKPMEIDRVDNVIEISPPDDDENNTSLFRRLLNPLAISKTKFVLIHKANVESIHPVLRTKISWTSTVLNVAGSSTSSTNQ